MPSEKGGKRKIYRAILFALTVGLLIYFCAYGNNLAVLILSLHTIRPFWIFCAAACVFLNWMADSLILHALVVHSGIGGYGFGSAFRVAMVGQYFNSVTPYALAGQPMQLVSLTSQGVSSGVAVSTLVRKFLVYQTSLTLYSFIVILVKYQFFLSKVQGFMALAVVGFLYQAAVVVGLMLFSYNPAFTTKLIHGAVWLLTRIHVVKDPEQTSRKVKDQLSFFLENNRAIQGNHLLKLKIYGLTAVQLTALFLVPFFIYKAFRNPGMPVFDMIAAQSFVTMVSSYTPLPGAAGAAEGSFLVIFQIFFSPEVIRQAMLLWRLIAYYSCIVVGAFFAVPRRRKPGRTPASVREQAKEKSDAAGMGSEPAADSGGIKYDE